MFGFSKKPKVLPETTAAAPEASVNPNTAIYTMPEKFFVAETPPFWTAKKIWTIVGVVMVVLIGLVYWLVSGIMNSHAPVSTTTTQSAAPTTATDLSSTTTTSTSPVVPPASDSTTETSASTASTDTTSTFSDTTITTPTDTSAAVTPVAPPPTVLPSSKDSDGDGLTDVEEVVWGTDPAKVDTDGDGYSDLSEIQNGYNPKGTGRLSTSGLISTYTSSKHRYAALYPSVWSAHASDVSEDDVIFTATPDEFMEISIQANKNNLSLVDWYHSIAPNVDTTALSTTTVGSHTGIFSPDHRTFYFIANDRPDEVFVVSYNVGTKTETNFTSTFLVLIQSLVVNP